ncbi:hypothetical protein E0Z10_g739 [Xylaria hypoxylon]|uniref:GP-PDE domain-containing protein n=1 Tax=Xylaria hypoxylon TaxID=37992 RepID=A0A4Z0YVJ2_9PEZI|nr:hypothetical protein E0Z10_g739 [Xylaria hypoxylon]
MQLAALPEAFSPDTVHGLFVFFVIHRSWQNVLMLLGHTASRENLNFSYDDIRILVAACVQETHSLEVGSVATTGSHQDIPSGSSALDVFARILELLGPANAKELFTRSSDEPPVLHLLAKYGLLEWCRLALGKIRDTKEELNITTIILSADRFKLTPLHYALIHNHPRVVDFFSEMLVEGRDKYQTSDCQALLASYLSLAVKFGKNDIVAQISRVTNPDLKSIYGITALHVAARDGRIDIIALLLRAGASVDVTEHPRGWTPLFEAAVNGWAEAVQHLIEHGADTTITGYLGWTAKELTTYRGHLAVAKLLHDASPTEHTQSIADNRVTKTITYRAGAEPEDIIVNVNLGSMQVGRNSPPVQLKYFSPDRVGGDESLFNLKISAAGRTYRIRLPILNDRVNVPLVFVFPQGADLQVAFKIFRADPEKSKDDVLVSGRTFLVENIFRSERIQLRFGHSKTYTLEQGLTSRKSFIAAANAGASFVEFGIGTGFPFFLTERRLLTFLDAQVTRDLTPVIYHDFSLSESGTDIPIHDVTVDQYKYTSSVQASQFIRDADRKKDSVASLYAKSRPRSLSQGCGVDPGVFQIRDRLKHTVDFVEKGMKSNTRGDFIQQPLATLKDLFDKVPKTVGFNVEIKYPRFHETVGAGVAPVALELNLHVDTILEHVRLYGGDRPIILSSFTPEVCILLSLKQRAYPVLFITNAGKLPMIDVEKRAANMHIAVKFAKLWNLTGIVFASEPLLLCPRLIRYVKSFGLICASYGPQNSLPDDVIVS